MLLFIKLGFFDILDIFIVAFIFYQIYRLRLLIFSLVFLLFMWPGCWYGLSIWN